MKSLRFFYLFIILVQPLFAMETGDVNTLYETIDLQADQVIMFVPTRYACCLIKFGHVLMQSNTRKNEIEFLEVLGRLKDKVEARVSPSELYVFLENHKHFFGDSLPEKAYRVMTISLKGFLTQLPECVICIEAIATCVTSCGHYYCSGCIEKNAVIVSVASNAGSNQIQPPSVIECRDLEVQDQQKESDVLVDKKGDDEVEEEIELKVEIPDCNAQELAEPRTCSLCRQHFSKYFKLKLTDVPSSCETCKKTKASVYYSKCGHIVECEECDKNACKTCGKTEGRIQTFP